MSAAVYAGVFLVSVAAISGFCLGVGLAIVVSFAFSKLPDDDAN